MVEIVQYTHTQQHIKNVKNRNKLQEPTVFTIRINWLVTTIYICMYLTFIRCAHSQKSSEASFITKYVIKREMSNPTVIFSWVYLHLSLRNLTSKYKKNLLNCISTTVLNITPNNDAQY